MKSDDLNNNLLELYEVMTENYELIGFFIKEQIAELYCKQGRNLSYKKIVLDLNSIKIMDLVD